MPYIPNTDDDQRRMLESIGASGIEELFEQIPADVRLQGDLDLPSPMSEIELRRHFANLADKNASTDRFACFLGAGIYDHYIPSTVAAVLGRSEFYTSYTPYQPEISQGTLQSIFEFQTLICQLTGMEVANASLYDGATGVAEAAIMASSVTKRQQWLVSECVNPAYRETLRTYAWATGYELTEAPRDGVASDLSKLKGRIGEETACVIVQNPNFFGSIEDLGEIESMAHEKGALLVVSFDPISLGLLKPPGEYNADIVVGEGQSLGLPMAFGGPLLGLFACKQQYMRQMPGRIVGATTDTEGKPGYVLTLQTREQHIRREKATSNICTNQGLCALAATVYLSTLGKTGLRQVAELCMQKAHYLADQIDGIDGCKLLSNRPFFKEFAIKCPAPVSEINGRLREAGLIGGLDLGRFYPELADCMLLCVTEKRTRDEMDRLAEALKQ
ncbi:MAG: aminomethyl-transferring glycine dehydrogenase subunit GcvPA [Armatimonadetes bacterium]|nr:aminomethyl-transferring glycine dehydrogenase subunit GcvPA [Armatimonadota bacterium]